MGGNSSRHVKSAKDQAPVHIHPKDLHQKPKVHKCNECGHPLELPVVEPWTIGIFDCAEDREICLTGLFCPCVMFGRNEERFRDGERSMTTPCIYHAIFVEGGIALAAGITGMAAFHCIQPLLSSMIYTMLGFTWCMCGLSTGQVRELMQKKYQLENTPCEPWMVHCCMHWCAICQEHREMEYRLSDNAVMPMTNAPPFQKMKVDGDDKSQDCGSSSANGINKIPT